MAFIAAHMQFAGCGHVEEKGEYAPPPHFWTLACGINMPIRVESGNQF